MTTLITVTGHRPLKLHGLDVDAFALEVFRHHAPAGVEFNIGMACAKACATLRIPFRAFVPFEGQENLWRPNVQTEYHRLLSRAEVVHVISKVSCTEAFKQRNRVMADNCVSVWALWDGSNGGTGHAVSYALAQGCKVWNCWGSFLEWSEAIMRK